METNLVPQTSTTVLKRNAVGIIAIVALTAYFFLHLVLLKWIGLLALGIRSFQILKNRNLTPTALEVKSPEVFRKANAQALKRALSKAQFETLTEKQAGQGLEQLQQNQERMTSFERTLSLKLDPRELTYSRYFEAANQVYLGIQDQLNDIATRLANILAVKASSELGDATADDQVRAGIKKAELDKVTLLLQLNETALTRMDQLTQAISDMKTQTNSASSDLKPLLAELEELAQRAKKY